MPNSQRKGKDGELELCKLLNTLFDCDSRRSQQYSGVTGDAADITTALDCHIECKRVERLVLAQAYDQAKKDAAKSGRTPVVCHRKSREPWMFTIKLEDLPRFMQENIHLVRS